MTIDLRCGPLVRAASPTTIVLWAELSSPCTVLLQAAPLSSPAPLHQPSTATARTVTLGGRYYVTLRLSGLQPETWYSYTFAIQDGQHITALPALPLQCFRTFGGESAAALRVLYGSCRKLHLPEVDILNALGDWLVAHFAEREAAWPHLLLLLGDQIYADDPPPALRARSPQLPLHAQAFEDYALMYEYAWTNRAGIRQALALLPTYMMFDDHEITNNWNISPSWRATMLRHGRGQAMVDGLIAYWVYQGWGNILADDPIDHPLLRIMQSAAQHDEDILEQLRDAIKQSIYSDAIMPWHYTIPTTPAIFVTNTRADRTTIFEHDSPALYDPTAIMEEGQLHDLEAWLDTHHASTVILASSVPVLLPPLIGLAEYWMGVRPWSNALPPLRWLGRKIAALQMRAAHKTSFDHWPVFAKTWRRLVDLFKKHKSDMLVLSGDVHFSYAAEARKTFCRTCRAHLYQFVSSPIQNELDTESRALIEQQSRLTRASYGGLHTHMLALKRARATLDIRRGIIYENTLGYLTVQRRDNEAAAIQHVYLGLLDGHLTEIAWTKTLSSRD